MSKSREQVQSWLKTIDVAGKTVLDVGAGEESKHVRYFVKGKPREFTACDIEKKTGIDFILDLNYFKSKFVKKYDYVFCIETLEHVWNPVRAIEILSIYTKEKLFISTPLLNPIHDTHDMLRYTMQWYENVLPRVGFKEVKWIPRVATAGKQYLANFYKIEGLRMSKITYKRGYGKNYWDIGYMIEAIK